MEVETVTVCILQFILFELFFFPLSSFFPLLTLGSERKGLLITATLPDTTLQNTGSRLPRSSEPRRSGEGFMDALRVASPQPVKQLSAQAAE